MAAPATIERPSVSQEAQRENIRRIAQELGYDISEDEIVSLLGKSEEEIKKYILSRPTPPRVPM